jgi:hypothetical protein
MKEWTPYRDEYLYEFIRNEGRGDANTTRCSSCHHDAGNDDSKPLYRCLDCGYPEMMCRACCVQKHENRPFDIIEVCHFLFSVSQ